jgi:hypothetical protein
MIDVNSSRVSASPVVVARLNQRADEVVAWTFSPFVDQVSWILPERCEFACRADLLLLARSSVDNQTHPHWERPVREGQSRESVWSFLSWVSVIGTILMAKALSFALSPSSM